jgi:galactokinase
MNIIKETFTKIYGEPKCAVFAPGRANIIGEHTDYNEGFVFPFAINQGVWFYAAPNGTRDFNILAQNTGENTTISAEKDDNIHFGWEKYFRQVLQAMHSYQLKGMNMVFGGNLPIGAGVSSSSAVTCGFLEILNELNDLNFNSDQLVQKAVEAEVGFGVRGGIMDQYTIINAIKNKAILLDCRTNTHEYIDLDLGNHHLCLINTKVKHNLINTDYNNRRAQCEEAVQLLSTHYRLITALRDIRVDELSKLAKILPEKLYNRASFVVQENQRVADAVTALSNRDFDKLGELLYASHDGLSQMYEVSCEELDWLVNFTLDKDEFKGARMMGGGFGGCTINLTLGALSDAIIEELSQKYTEKFGFPPEIIPVAPEDGILQKKANAMKL